METQASRIGSFAVRAMLLEVFAAPKPGLVDRQNDGAHRDMGLLTFISSIRALAPHMTEFARIGLASAGQSPQHLFQQLRRQGIQAEKDMFQATCGVNTHKGMIFSLGLLCGAAGYLQAETPTIISPSDLCEIVAQMTAGLCERELSAAALSGKLSNGERIYLQYGASGVRGEAESGFASIRQYGYPILDHCLRQGDHSLNDVLVHTLISLMANVTDTNVLSRHDETTAVYVHEQARQALAAGGALTDAGQTAIKTMDQDFICRNISPGGCADLLAAAMFLWLFSHRDCDALLTATCRLCNPIAPESVSA